MLKILIIVTKLNIQRQYNLDTLVFNPILKKLLLFY